MTTQTPAAARRAEKRAQNEALGIASGSILPKSGGETSNGCPTTPKRLNRKPGAKKRKIPARTIRKRLVKALDAAFSLYVRSLWKACPFCGGRVEHCFHFVTRAKYSVRWDERNAVGSCAGCNYRYEFDPHFAVTWYIAWKGLEAYEVLVRDGNRTAKHPNEELAAMLADFSARRASIV